MNHRLMRCLIVLAVFSVLLLGLSACGTAATVGTSIAAYIVQEGAYVIRCSWTNTEDVGLVSSIEFIPNEEFGAHSVKRYGMTIPYILPEDRNMNMQVDGPLIDD